ncbi:hypothetical protein ES692_00720 [Psychroserpens burtonensis]|uniref:Uncharacterized protein n=1 Tax=Psychroserpens burtonensis TaxID=49278 RepID=A0A5C7BBZ9_9FLAO|nr:hypothetical protein [Psychroserpens burtonensis]TXE20345.1 hypothetical protein ES692_00720 [Psychroserpens burtonensis]
MSIVFSIFNDTIRGLSWIDLWGNTKEWVIRILLTVGGVVYFFSSKAMKMMTNSINEKYNRMKTLQCITLVVIVSMALMSCGSDSGNEPATASGFSDIENQIKSEFGDEAYFTDMSIIYNKSIGNIVGVTVTKDPNSLKMGQWNETKGHWKQNQEISLEVPQGTKAEDFMYQLNNQISLTTLGALAEKSSKQLTTDESIEAQS